MLNVGRGRNPIFTSFREKVSHHLDTVAPRSGQFAQKPGHGEAVEQTQRPGAVESPRDPVRRNGTGELKDGQGWRRDGDPVQDFPFSLGNDRRVMDHRRTVFFPMVVALDGYMDRI